MSPTFMNNKCFGSAAQVTSSTSIPFQVSIEDSMVWEFNPALALDLSKSVDSGVSLNTLLLKTQRKKWPLGYATVRKLG